MNLYLHIGTEKTGSSFLQSYLARHRKTLEKHKICFPHAGEQEANMQKGIITPGNATELEKNIELSKWDNVHTWLQHKIKEAYSKQCNTILLSNEILILRFAEEEKLSKFLGILDALDVTLKGILLIIREPVAQTMSLYKHRIKNGKFKPIEKWLQTNYLIAEALQKFYDALSKTNVPLNQYAYQKDSNYLIDVCLNKWLGLQERINIKPRIVNPSLTLSELLLLSEISKKDKILAKKFYDFMLRIDAKNKSDDNFYKSYVNAHINNHMAKYNELWNLVNSKMTANKTSYNYKPCLIPSDHKITSYSATQVETIAKFINYSKSLGYRKHKAMHQINKQVRILTPKFLKKIIKRIIARN